MQVGKVAAASAGDEDLLPYALGAFQQGDTASAASGREGTHESRCAAAKYNRMVVALH